MHTEFHQGAKLALLGLPSVIFVLFVLFVVKPFAPPRGRLVGPKTGAPEDDAWYRNGQPLRQMRDAKPSVFMNRNICGA